MVEYTLIRSDRRTLGLEITPELTVVVRAPRRCSEREIRRFVESHTDWIQRHLEIQRRRQMVRAARQVTPEQEAQLRRQAAEYIPGRVAVYAARMGVTPTGVRITGAQKRFGSCSGKNSLCFSWRQSHKHALGEPCAQFQFSDDLHALRNGALHKVLRPGDAGADDHDVLPGDVRIRLLAQRKRTIHFMQERKRAIKRAFFFHIVDGDMRAQFAKQLRRRNAAAGHAADHDALSTNVKCHVLSSRITARPAA